MSTKSHLSRNLANLIQTIGQTNSKDAQDRIITTQINNLKSNIALNPKQQDFFQILIKLLYIETLGHDGSFVHIHAVNLTQSKSLKMKRLGYLLITLCIKTNSKFSILLLSSIQKDLTSTSLHNVVVCLTALPKMINSIIIEACLDTILKLIKHPTDLVRKKALLVLEKIYKLDKEKLPTFKTILQESLDDDEPPVVFISIVILKELIEEHPERYKELTDNLCVVLKDIITHKYRKEYDYHKIPAPWMQITILKLLEILGKNDPKSSHKMYQVLEKALRRSTYNQLHVSNAILIQCIKTICLIYPNQTLISEAKDFIWRFFQRENHNMKCFGLGVLNVLAKIDPISIKDWQYQIIDCLQSNDTTLATSAVELLAKISNQQNCQTIVEKLIDVARKQTDKNFQIKLIKKCLMLTELHSSTPEIYIESTNNILLNFHGLIDSRSLNSYISVLVEAIESNGEYVGVILEKYEELLETTEILHILKVSLYMIGEYSNRLYNNNEEKIEYLVSKILEVGEKIEDPATLEYMIQALVKISALEGFKQYDQIKNFLLKLEGNEKMEIYKIAEEMSRLGKFGKAMLNCHSLKIDSNLSFLDKCLVENGIPLEKKISERSGLIPMKKLVEESSLNFKPYSIGEHKKKVLNQEELIEPSTVELSGVGNDESILKFSGPKKWTPSGYGDKIPQSNMNEKEKKDENPHYLEEEGRTRPRGFTLKGPNEKAVVNAPKKIAVDQRKINLARNIFR